MPKYEVDFIAEVNEISGSEDNDVIDSQHDPSLNVRKLSTVVLTQSSRTSSKSAPLRNNVCHSSRKSSATPAQYSSSNGNGKKYRESPTNSRKRNDKVKVLHNLSSAYTPAPTPSKQTNRKQSSNFNRKETNSSIATTDYLLDEDSDDLEEEDRAICESPKNSISSDYHEICTPPPALRVKRTNVSHRNRSRSLSPKQGGHRRRNTIVTEEDDIKSLSETITDSSDVDEDESMCPEKGISTSYVRDFRNVPLPKRSESAGLHHKSNPKIDTTDCSYQSSHHFDRLHHSSLAHGMKQKDFKGSSSKPSKNSSERSSVVQSYKIYDPVSTSSNSSPEEVQSGGDQKYRTDSRLNNYDSCKDRLKHNKISPSTKNSPRRPPSVTRAGAPRSLFSNNSNEAQPCSRFETNCGTHSSRVVNDSSRNTSRTATPQQLFTPSSSSNPSSISHGKQKLLKKEFSRTGQSPLPFQPPYALPQCSMVKQRFYLQACTNIEQMLRDPNDRRLKAICDRFHCDFELYSKVPKNGTLQYVIRISAPSMEYLRKCVRNLDSTMKWSLSCQIKESRTPQL